MAQVHAKSGEVVSLAPLGPLLATSSTVAIIKQEQLEVVRIVLRAGKSLPEHHVPGEITVFCIEGSVEFSQPDKSDVLKPGDFLHLQGNVPHALRALADSSLLVTIRLTPK